MGERVEVDWEAMLSAVSDECESLRTDLAIARERIAMLERSLARCDEPTLSDLVREMREALGMYHGAMPVSPKEAWEEALQRARQLVQGSIW